METNDKLIEPKRNKNRTLGKHRQSDEIESSSCSKRRRSSNDQNDSKMLAYFATKMMVSLHAISTFAKNQNIKKAAVEMQDTEILEKIYNADHSDMFDAK